MGEEEVDGEKDGDEDMDEEDFNEEDKFNKEERDECARIFGESSWKNVYRSKGMIYSASQCNSMFTWQTSGIVNEIRHLGKWLASGSKDELYEKGHQEEYESWTDKKQGDRKTQLVIIGSGIDKDGITKMLDDCLVSEEEYEKMKVAEGIVDMEITGEDEDPFRPVEDEDEDE